MPPLRNAAALVVALALTVPVAASAGAAPGDPWPTWAPESGGEFRTAAYEAGEWVYRNGIYQAMGPNVDGLYREDYFAAMLTGPELPQEDRDDLYRHLTYGAFGFDRSTHNGDYELPRDRETWPDFTADLAVVRLRVSDDELFVRMRFTSMPRADAQIATLTFATHGDTPAEQAWPNGAGVSSPWEVAVTAWGTAGQVDGPTGTGTLAAVGGDIRASVEDRTWELRLPLEALPPAPWRLTGGAGLADRDDPSTYWDVPAGRATESEPGSGADETADANVWTLLFAEGEDWHHDERVQSDLLASGVVTPASAVVDPARITAGEVAAEEPRTGRLSRFYVSAADLGDGIERSPGQVPPFPPPFVPPPGVDLRDPGVTYTYRNDLQPHFLYVPGACVDGGCPLVVWLHGLNNYPYEPFGLFLGLEDLLEERGYILTSVLGRGDLFYTGVGELDVLEAIEDVTATYDIDARRVHVMGLSMGSDGTHRIATHHPDRVASASGFTLSGYDALLENLRHVPHLLSHGREDFFDPGGQSTGATYDRISGLGYDTVYYDWFEKTHESATFYDIGVPLFDRLDASVAPATPGELSFVRPVDSDTDREFGLVHDRAYWLTGIEAADPTTTGRVYARSFAIEHAPLDPASAERTATEDPGLGLPSGRGAHLLHVTTPAFGDPGPLENRLALELDDLAGLTVQTATAGLDIDGLTVEVDAAQDVVLRFTDAERSAYGATLDGAPHDVVVEGDVVTAEVPSGSHVLVFTAVAPPASAPPDLPATGGGLAVAALVALAAGARRRRGIT